VSEFAELRLDLRGHVGYLANLPRLALQPRDGNFERAQ
jgi:hypothetical protein